MCTNFVNVQLIKYKFWNYKRFVTLLIVLNKANTRFKRIKNINNFDFHKSKVFQYFFDFNMENFSETFWKMLCFKSFLPEYESEKNITTNHMGLAYWSGLLFIFDRISLSSGDARICVTNRRVDPANPFIILSLREQIIHTSTTWANNACIE